MWKEDIENGQMGNFESPGIKEWVYTTIWIFGEFIGFLWKMLLESKVFLFNNFFNTNLLIFLKIQTVIKVIL